MNFLNGLTLVFIALKLAGVISWPWVAVVAPSIGFISIVTLVTLLDSAGILEKFTK